VGHPALVGTIVKAVVGFARLIRPTYPDFLLGAPPTSTCAAFIKESRMMFPERKRGRQEIRSTLRRTWGTRPIPVERVGSGRLAD
jgi:hypothetical protein